jgi:hypothetical protein
MQITDSIRHRKTISSIGQYASDSTTQQLTRPAEAGLNQPRRPAATPARVVDSSNQMLSPTQGGTT